MTRTRRPLWFIASMLLSLLSLSLSLSAQAAPASQTLLQRAADHRQPDQDTQQMRVRHVSFFRRVSARTA